MVCKQGRPHHNDPKDNTPIPASNRAAIVEAAESRTAAPPNAVPAEDAPESELLLLDDIAVPSSCLATLLDSVAEIASRHRLTIGVCTHVGDGNAHPVVFFDAAARTRESFGEIMALGLDAATPSRANTTSASSRSTGWPASSAPCSSTSTAPSSPSSTRTHPQLRKGLLTP